MTRFATLATGPRIAWRLAEPGAAEAHEATDWWARHLAGENA